MQFVNMPSNHYAKILDVKRIKKFTRIHINSFFGMKKAAIYLKTTPIKNVQIFLSDPGYETELSTFYPLYMGEIVLLGYIIINKCKDCDFQITDSKVIIKKKELSDNPEAKAEGYEKGFVSKQMLMLKNKYANLFIPAIKYDDQQVTL